MVSLGDAAIGKDRAEARAWYRLAGESSDSRGWFRLAGDLQRDEDPSASSSLQIVECLRKGENLLSIEAFGMTERDRLRMLPLMELGRHRTRLDQMISSQPGLGESPWVTELRGRATCDPWAMVRLGECFLQGEGVFPDDKQACSWFEKALAHAESVPRDANVISRAARAGLAHLQGASPQ
jgi:TPR repeat protein